MAIFTFKKKSAQAKPARKVRITMPKSEAPAKDPRTAVALQLRAPTPFPSAAPPAVLQHTAGGKSRLVASAGTRKWRRRRPLLVERGTPGAMESSDSEGPADEEGGKVKKQRRKVAINLKPYQLEAKSRYMRKDSYKPGDHVMVKDWVIERGYIWRHGVVADFEQYPPRLLTIESSLLNYPVTYDYNGEEKTEYFSPVRCGILYDKLRSSVAAAHK
ncbi:hypothetical protein C2E23DRAFT_551745 [Lenzites betulinus]|nr:hypothetical protein C2E23DRAFT_551745 [Lenzites betulinus]